MIRSWTCDANIIGFTQGKQEWVDQYCYVNNHWIHTTTNKFTTRTQIQNIWTRFQKLNAQALANAKMGLITRKLVGQTYYLGVRTTRRSQQFVGRTFIFPCNPLSACHSWRMTSLFLRICYANSVSESRLYWIWVQVQVTVPTAITQFCILHTGKNNFCYCLL